MSSLSSSVNYRHAEFLDRLPTIQKHAEFVFRRWRPDDRRQDAISESVAAAWALWASMVRRSIDPTQVTATALARFAVGHTLKGRRISNTNTGGRGSRDIYRVGRKVQSIADQSGLEHADRSPGVSDLTVSRLDFEQWIGSHSERDREILRALAQGDGTVQIASRFKISPARVSQIRAEAERSWNEFQTV